jgi:hypothetical protein
LTKALLASLEVSSLVVKNKKPHSIGKKLLLPAAMKMGELMNGNKCGEALKIVPLSNSIVMQCT